MKILRQGIVQTLMDNDENYIQLLSGILESVDEYCSLMITRSPESILFRIAPSSPKYVNSIIKDVIDFHNFLGIRVVFSKSIKNTSSILFKLPIS
jgi:hypothetical protein